MDTPPRRKRSTRKKARWELHNATCSFEQILEAAPHKTSRFTVTYFQSNEISKLSSNLDISLEDKMVTSGNVRVIS